MQNMEYYFSQMKMVCLLTILIVWSIIPGTSSTKRCTWPSFERIYKVKYKSDYYLLFDNPSLNHENLCNQWAREARIQTHFVGIRDRDVTSRRCVIAFVGRNGRTIQCHHVTKVVSLPAKPYSRCEDPTWSIIGWRKGRVWTTRKTPMEIIPVHEELTTKIKLNGRANQLVIDKIVITKSVHGRHYAEVHIYHEWHQSLGNQISVFHVKLRNSPINSEWKRMITARRRRSGRFRYNIIDIQRLVFHSHKSVQEVEKRLSYFKRYSEHLTRDSSNVDRRSGYTWTVYETPIFISRLQWARTKNYLEDYNRRPSTAEADYCKYYPRRQR